MNPDGRILIVDDDADVLLATSRLLEKAGHEVLQAGSGEEGLQMALKNRPALVLLDVVLPDASGMEVCRRIKSDPELAGTFVLLTSHVRTSSDEQARGLESRADGYVARPVSNRELLARVEAMLRIRRAEQELEAYRQELENRVEARTRELAEAREALLREERLADLGRLAGGVGHELRNPLGAIKNGVYYLNMALEDPAGDVRDTLEILDREVAETERILQDLFDGAVPKPPAIRPGLDLNDRVRDCLARAVIPGSVEVVVNLDEALPGVDGDPDQLNQVLRNLVRNGIQAMPDGGRLEVSTEALPPDRVCIRVSDAGTGIPEENREKVFEPLFTTKARGIGLGLALSKRHVEAHGGTLELESRVGEGTSFTIVLPCRRPV